MNQLKKLSVIIPAYNEVDTINECIERVLHANTLGLELEIVISDNVSTDGTREKLKKITNENIIIHFRKNHSGKGANVISALKRTTGDIILIQDADLEYNPKDYPSVLEPFFHANADVVYGSRLTGGKYHRVFGILHLFANKFLTLSANILYNATFTDIETATKVFRKDVITNLNLKSKGFEIEPEITSKIMKNKTLRVFEVPVTHAARNYSEGKKVRWWHFFTSLASLIKWRFIKYN